MHPDRSIFSRLIFIHIIKIFFRKYGIFAYFVAIIFMCQCVFAYYLVNMMVSDVGFISSNQRTMPSLPHVSDSHSRANPFSQEDESFAKKESKKDDIPQNVVCDTLGRDAQSAIRRAKSQECRDQIVNISCQVQKGTFFPKRLKRFCSSSDYVSGKSLGCYVDRRNSRILTGYSVILKLNSPSLCSDICLQRGYIYAGVQYGKECFCGDDPLPIQFKTASKECDMVCIGQTNSDLKCGGYLRADIFQTGLGKQIPYALQKYASKEMERVRIVFILTVNGRALRQVIRLIKALYHQNHYIFIHVDSSQHYLYRNLLKLEDRFSNIMVSRTRYRSIWGGASLLTVLLHCMKSLLDRSDWHWDFAINLSESDFPIKSVSSLEDFLTANKERNFLKTHGQNTNTFFQKQGLDRTFLECETHMWRIGRRKLPLGIRFDGGSDWFCLNRNFINYVVHSDDQLVSGLKHFFSYTLLPAESFFHTVLRNSEYCNTFTDNNLRMTNWNRKLGCRCQYKDIVDWCGCSPNDFTPNEWQKLLATKEKHWYFGRKFEPIKNLEIINKVDQWIHGDFIEGTPSLHSYWENRYHLDDHPSQKTDAELTLFTSIMKLFCNSSDLRSSFIRTSKTEGPKQCNLTPVKLLEVYSYSHLDKYMGFLVTFKISTISQAEAKLQLYVQRQNYLKLHNDQASPYFITDLQVGSKFDLKEQIFRSGEGALGQLDTVTIVTWWTDNGEDSKMHNEVTEETFNAHLYIQDPLGRYVDNGTLEINQESKSLVLHHIIPKTVYKPAGLWKVFVVHNGQVLASSRFAVFPVLFNQGLEISEHEQLEKKETYQNIEIEEKAVPSALKDTLDFADLYQMNISEERSRRGFVAELIKEFYRFEGLCTIGTFDGCSFNVSACDNSPWSSEFPDPKSVLTEVNSRTGKLHEFYRLPKS